MRPRKKKHAPDRLFACRQILLEDPKSQKGTLRNAFPNPQAPLCLELGCGKGKFITQLAAENPGVNYIAFEREPDVGVIAVEAVAQAGLQNVRFVLDDATFLQEMFLPGEIARIYINFCDPWHKNRHARRRLTHRDYLKCYLSVLEDGGEIRFKTDNYQLYHFSLWEFQSCTQLIFKTEDLHRSEQAAQNIMTEYETLFSEKGMNIYALWGRKPPAGSTF